MLGRLNRWPSKMSGPTATAYAVGESVHYKIARFRHELSEIAFLYLTKWLYYDQSGHHCISRIQHPSESAQGLDAYGFAAFYFYQYALQLWHIAQLEIAAAVYAGVSTALLRNESVNLFNRPLLELVLITLPQVLSALNRQRGAFDQSATHCQPHLGDQLDRIDRNVYPDPIAPQPMRRLNCCGASTERVKNGIAFVATGGPMTTQ